MAAMLLSAVDEYTCNALFHLSIKDILSICMETSHGHRNWMCLPSWNIFYDIIILVTSKIIKLKKRCVLRGNVCT